jgi:acyl carrier protein
VGRAGVTWQIVAGISRCRQPPEGAQAMEKLRSDMQEIFRQVFGDDAIELRDEMTAADVDGWDSLMHINLIIAVERHFKIKFATAEISELKGDDQNVGTFLRMVAKKANRA